MKLSFDPQIEPQLSEAIESSLKQLVSNHSVDIGTDSLAVSLSSDKGKYQISPAFNELFRNRQFSFKGVLGKTGCVSRDDGSVDYLSTMVYMLNYLQEYGVEEADDLGRFPYESSYQSRFNVPTENLVLAHFRDFVNSQFSKQITSKKSRLFVSHDNDSLFGSFTKDGLYALKKGRVDWLFRIVWNEIMRNPGWMNMDRMMDINDEYDLRSTFFWISNNHQTRIGNRNLSNGDYQIEDGRILTTIEKIASRGFHQGLHKSVNSTDFSSELNRLPFSAKSNRNHYLKLKIPSHFEDVDTSQIEIDFSLGFAEEFGLRNNYPMPFRPYDIERGKTTRSLFVPLMIMDATNWSYRKQDLKSLKSTLMDLLDKHREDAIISILWHNKYFTNMKFGGYLEVYRSMLDFCRQNDVLPITEEEILEKYSSK